MSKLTDYINFFSRQKIIVVGDLIADEFVIGQPERFSREAPIMILRHKARKLLPGGGANAANNIVSLNGKVNMVGTIGNDEIGFLLKDVLQKKGIDTTGLIIDDKRFTSVKTRIIATGEQIVKQQVIRIDRVDTKGISVELEDKILSYVKENIDEASGILLSDYGNGVFTERIKRELLQLALIKDKFIAVDSRYNLLDYQGASIITPNLEEVDCALDTKISSQAELIEAGKKLRARLNLKYLLITQGGEGMTLFKENNDYLHIPVANYSEVFDVTGAGDTVISTLSLAFLAGADIDMAVKLANYAAGIVVRKSGVATVSQAELIGEVSKNEG